MKPSNARRVTVKLYAEEPVDVDPAALVRVFHGWIQDDVLPDRIMIDVADYSHVPEGPGVVLICHEAHYSFDHAGGRPGLRCILNHHGYREERDPIGEALLSALRVCAMLQAEPGLCGSLRFKTDELYLGVEDRLVAPNTDETFRDIQRHIEQRLAAWCSGTGEVAMRPVGGPEEPFGLQVSVAAAPRLDVLIRRLER